MQSRIDSLYETLFSLVVGFTINFFLNAAIFPLFGWQISGSQNVKLVLLYTVVSVIRSYFVRRYFNHRLRRRMKHGHA